MKRVAVIGIGNAAFGDAGVGSYIIEALDQEEWPAHIELVDIGPCIHQLELYLYERDYALLVQGISRGYRWGHIYQLSGEELRPMYREACCCWNRPVMERLHLAEYLGVMPPEITFVGIEPRMTCFHLGLSKEVRLAIRKAVRVVKANLVQRGFLPASQVIPLVRYRLGLLQITI
ncbi:MAG: hydrogenase maturation protease [Bacillota bacterium]